MFRIWPNFFCKKLVSDLEFNIITCFFLHFCYELKVLTTALKRFVLSISKNKRVLTGCSSGYTSRASLHAYSVLHSKTGSMRGECRDTRFVRSLNIVDKLTSLRGDELAIIDRKQVVFETGTGSS